MFTASTSHEPEEEEVGYCYVNAALHPTNMEYYVRLDGTYISERCINWYPCVIPLSELGVDDADEFDSDPQMV